MANCSVLMVICGCVLIAPWQCFAWNGAGHMVIAAIAYGELASATRSNVDLILMAQPDYEQWKSSFTRDGAGLDLGLYVFMEASKWPDEVRKRKGGYDQPQWHYIDYPLKG